MSCAANEQSQLVSVILPVYNGEEFLDDAIQSVLAQSYRTLELIVVDDGSTDRTREIALSYPKVKYIHQLHRGAAAARNNGILASFGKYLAFLDADDLWQPDKLSIQVNAFEMYPAVEIVTGHVQQFSNSDSESPHARNYRFSNEPMPGYLLIAILIKRDVLAKVGMFDESCNSEAEVIDWFVKIREKKPNILVLPQLVAKRRIHGQNISLIHQEDKNRAMIQILKNSLDRKRAGGVE